MAFPFFTSCDFEESKIIIGPESQSPSQEDSESSNEQNQFIDVVFVLENSTSMYQESIALSQEIGGFADSVVNLEPAVDLQIALTTASVEHTSGSSAEVDPGEAGLLFGEPNNISASEFVSNFRRELLCEATYWDRNSLPSDPSYECEQESIQITVEYLDCLCEDDAWDGIAGSAIAEPIEAALLAMCRSETAPPEVCYDAIAPFTEADEGTNTDFIREDSTVIFVIVGDGGDSSRRLQQGEFVPDVYQEAFDSFGRNITFVALGPNYDLVSEEIICNSGDASGWMVERLLRISEASEGFFFPLEIYNNQGNCTSNYFSSFYSELLSLL